MSNENFVERRKPTARGAGTLVVTRIMLGIVSIMHGIAGLIFDHSTGVSHVIRHIDGGWVMSVMLIVAGGLMAFAAVAELRGFEGRWCREFASSFLGAAWIFMFAFSFINGADYLTLVAPVYVVFLSWAVIAEAHVARRMKTTKKHVAQPVKP